MASYMNALITFQKDRVVDYDFPCGTGLSYELLDKDRGAVLADLGRKGWQVKSQAVMSCNLERGEGNTLTLVASEVQFVIEKEVDG